MGLSILMLKKNIKVISFDISEELHNKIFDNNKKWTNTNQIRKLKDFYCDTKKFKNEEAKEFIKEMRIIAEYNNLTDLLDMDKRIKNIDIDTILASGD